MASGHPLIGILATFVPMATIAAVPPPGSATGYRRLANQYRWSREADQEQKAFRYLVAHREIVPTEDALFMQAILDIDAGDCGSAATPVGMLIGHYPKSPLVGDALIAGGECRLWKKEYAAAHSYFIEVIRREAPESEMARVRILDLCAEPEDATLREQCERWNRGSKRNQPKSSATTEEPGTKDAPVKSRVKLPNAEQMEIRTYERQGVLVREKRSSASSLLIRQRRSVKNPGRPVGNQEAWYGNGLRAWIESYDDSGSRHGDWVYWDEQGRKIREGSYERGRKVGEWSYRYTHGKPVLKGIYKGGERDGVWRVWYPNGKLQAEMTFVAGQKHGPTTTYWQKTGTKHEEGEYVGGKKSGRWLWWRQDGILQHEEHFENGEKTVWLNYHENGQKWSRYVYDHGALTSHTSWHANGHKAHESFSEGGKTHGLYRSWYKNGQLKERSEYDHGQLHGTSESWYENGQLKARGTRVNGKHKLWEIWHENGQLKARSTFVNEKLEGVRESWHSNGRPACRGSFVDGRRDGKHECWFQNGMRESVCVYHADRKTGTCQQWEEIGTKDAPAIHTESLPGGRHAEIRTFEDDGVLVKETRESSSGRLRFVKIERRSLKSSSVPVGAQEAWYGNGNRASIESYDDAGRRHGKWVYWDRRGRMTTEEFYEHGRKVGQWSTWEDFDRRGRVLTKRLTYLYDGDEAVIEEETLYPNGRRKTRGRISKRRSGGYMNHDLPDGCPAWVREGPWTQWHENGRVQARGSYHRGVRMGPWEMWHRNGRKRAEITYVESRGGGVLELLSKRGSSRSPCKEDNLNNGTKGIPWRTWYSNGQLEWHVTHQFTKGWDKDGKLTTNVSNP